MAIANQNSIVDQSFIERRWTDNPERCDACRKDEAIVLRQVSMFPDGVEHKQYCSRCAIELAKTKITDTTTTENETKRTFIPERIETRRTDLVPESVSVKCGSLEIIPIPHSDGRSGPPRYRVLIDGKPVATKEISLHLGIDCIAEARIVWIPDRSEWG